MYIELGVPNITYYLEKKRIVGSLELTARLSPIFFTKSAA